jgi:hypothetical protein
MPEFEEATVVMGDGRIWERQFRGRCRIGPLRVVPNDQAPVLDLLGDQLVQVFGDDGHYFTRPFCRSSLLIEDHSYSFFSSVELEVILATLHVPVVRIERPLSGLVAYRDSDSRYLPRRL